MGRGNEWSQGPSRSKRGSLLLGDGRGWEAAATPVGSQRWGGAAGSLRALVQEDEGRWGRGQGGRDSWAQTGLFPRYLIDAVGHLRTPSIPEVHCGQSTGLRARGRREPPKSVTVALQGLGRQPSA